MTTLLSRNRIQKLFVPLFLFLLGMTALASGYEPAFAQGAPARSSVGTDNNRERGIGIQNIEAKPYHALETPYGHNIA